MWLMWMAVVLSALKSLALLDVLAWSEVRDMSWWWVGACFAATSAWWWWADNFGYTQRKAQERTQQQQNLLRIRRAQRLMR